MSRIGEGSLASGTLSGSGSLEIAGSLEGEVVWDGDLTALAESRVRADGTVARLDLAGTLEGTFRVAESGVVRTGARWIGRCDAPILTVEAGAWIEGEVHVPGKPNEER